MSPKLPLVTGAQLARALERDGWRRVRQRGSHVIMRHDGKPGRVAVPVHAGQDVPIGTLRTILDGAGLDADDLRRLL